MCKQEPNQQFGNAQKNGICRSENTILQGKQLLNEDWSAQRTAICTPA